MVESGNERELWSGWAFNAADNNRNSACATLSTP